MPFIDREKKALLSADTYDNDAPDVERSGQSIELQAADRADSDDGRTSKELAERDREVLDDDYEREELLTGSQRQGVKGIFGGESNSGDTSKRAGKRKEGRNPKRSRRRKRLEGESEMMFEMEEGGRLTPNSEEEDSRGSLGSSEADLKRLVDVREQKSVCYPSYVDIMRCADKSRRQGGNEPSGMRPSTRASSYYSQFFSMLHTERRN